MAREVSGLALGAVGAGVVLVYGGLTGRSPLTVLQQVIRGSAPSKAAKVTAVNYGDTRPENAPGAHIGGGGVGPAVANFLLQDMRMSYAGAAGWLGNFQLESSLSTTAYNPDEGAIGLAQWEDGRRQHLQAIAARMGLTETDLAAQLAMIKNECHGGDAGAVTAYMLTKNASDPRRAAATVDINFERSDGTTRTQREDYASTWFSELKGAAAAGGRVR